MCKPVHDFPSAVNRSLEALHEPTGLGKKMAPLYGRGIEGKWANSYYYLGLPTFGHVCTTLNWWCSLPVHGLFMTPWMTSHTGHNGQLSCMVTRWPKLVEHFFFETEVTLWDRSQGDDSHLS